MSLAKTSFAGKAIDSLEAPDIYGIKETKAINETVNALSDTAAKAATKLRTTGDEVITFAKDTKKKVSTSVKDVIGEGGRFVGRLDESIQSNIVDRMGLGEDSLNFVNIGNDPNCIQSLIGNHALIRGVFGALGELVGDTTAFLTSSIDGTRSALGELLNNSILMGIGACVIKTMRDKVTVDEVFKGVLEDNVRNSALAGDIYSLELMVEELGPERVRGQLRNVGSDVISGYRLPSLYVPSHSQYETTRLNALLDDVKDGWDSSVVGDKRVQDLGVFRDMSDDSFALLKDNPEFATPVGLRDQYPIYSTTDLLATTYPNAVLT